MSLTVRSGNSRQVAADRYDVTGDSRIRDATTPVTVSVTRVSETAVNGNAQVRLTNYGLKPPSAALGLVGTKERDGFLVRIEGLGVAMQPAAATICQESKELGINDTFKAHWPEYLCEAAGLALFMISACVFTVFLEHPISSIHQAIEPALIRRALMGVAMGATAIAIIMSPFGQRSGAHLNPSITVNYYLLGKVRRWDALFYVGAQFAGGITGVAIASAMIGPPLRNAAVQYAVTVPGPDGPWVAFAAEVAIAGLLMFTVLLTSNSRRWSRLTPYFAGLLVATYYTVESPLSGMSMNPARTVGSAAGANVWTALWVYFTAPPLGMFAAVRLYGVLAGANGVYCAKLHHHNRKRCIFRCNHAALDS